MFFIVFSAVAYARFLLYLVYLTTILFFCQENMPAIIRILLPCTNYLIRILLPYANDPTCIITVLYELPHPHITAIRE